MGEQFVGIPQGSYPIISDISPTVVAKALAITATDASKLVTAIVGVTDILGTQRFTRDIAKSVIVKAAGPPKPVRGF